MKALFVVKILALVLLANASHAIEMRGPVKPVRQKADESMSAFFQNGIYPMDPAEEQTVSSQPLRFRDGNWVWEQQPTPRDLVLQRTPMVNRAGERPHLETKLVIHKVPIRQDEPQALSRKLEGAVKHCKAKMAELKKLTNTETEKMDLILSRIRPAPIAVDKVLGCLKKAWPGLSDNAKSKVTKKMKALNNSASGAAVAKVPAAPAAESARASAPAAAARR